MTKSLLFAAAAALVMLSTSFANAKTLLRGGNNVELAKQQGHRKLCSNDPNSYWKGYSGGDQTCYVVKGTSQHCWSNESGCEPSGPNWKAMENNNYDMCGTQCTSY